MEIEKIKEQNDIVKLIQSSGVELYGTTTLTGLCPFHEDRNPSLKVQPSKQWFWCYGGCSGGDVFQWVMQRDHCTFPEAVQKLQNGNLASPIVRKVREPVQRPHIPNLIVEDYHSNLISRPEAIRWLENNRFWSRPTIEKYKIGFDPNTYRFTIPIPSPVVNVWEDIRMYDALKNHEVKMLPFQRGASALPYFLTHDNDYLLIVEGEPDALACHSLGLNVATNTCGSSAANKVWREWYGLVFPQNIILCFDNDEAGHKALYEGERSLTNLFPSAKVATLPPELGNKADPTDAIRTYGADWFKNFIIGGKH